MVGLFFFELLLQIRKFEKRCFEKNAFKDKLVELIEGGSTLKGCNSKTIFWDIVLKGTPSAIFVKFCRLKISIHFYTCSISASIL